MKRSEVRTYIPKSEKKFFMEARRRNCLLRSLKRIAQNNKNNLSITINNVESHNLHMFTIDNLPSMLCSILDSRRK